MPTIDYLKLAYIAKLIQSQHGVDLKQPSCSGLSGCSHSECECLPLKGPNGEVGYGGLFCGVRVPAKPLLCTDYSCVLVSYVEGKTGDPRLKILCHGER